MPGVLEAKLATLGYSMPTPFTYPSPNRTGCVLVGNIAFVSGHGLGLPPLPDVRAAGKLGVDVSDAEGSRSWPRSKRRSAISIASNV
jgi:hypothetical protein